MAKKARNILNNFKKECLESESTNVLVTFELERTLPLPHLNTGEVYYLRPLHAFNFEIHSYKHGGEKVCMNLWYETMGARGSREVTSCLYQYFTNNIPISATKLILFSDCCGDQNRN